MNCELAILGIRALVRIIANFTRSAHCKLLAAIDKLRSNSQSGLNNLLVRSKLLALTPNPSPKLGRGEQIDLACHDLRPN
jgi:hypothetical protein